MQYRIYFLDDGNRIQDVAEFTAAGDEEALAIAQDLCQEHPLYDRFTLWSGARQVVADANCPAEPG